VGQGRGHSLLKAFCRERKGPQPGLGEGSLELASGRLRFLLRLRGVDLLACNPLLHHHKGVTDLFVGASNSDVAFIVRTLDQSIGRDPGARDVVDLFKALPPLPNNVCSRHIGNGHSHEVTVRFTLLREGLCEVEGEGVRRYSVLLGRFVLLGWQGLRRGRSSLSLLLSFGRMRGRSGLCRRG